MRILVYPHQLVMGGSQINAIELAAAVRPAIEAAFGPHLVLQTPLLDRLAADPDLRRRLGDFGRSMVEAHCSLDHAADRLIGIYEEAIAARPPPAARLASLCRSAARVAKFRAVTGWRTATRRAAQ